jgi:hypothetical protein
MKRVFLLPGSSLYCAVVSGRIVLTFCLAVGIVTRDLFNQTASDSPETTVEVRPVMPQILTDVEQVREAFRIVQDPEFPGFYPACNEAQAELFRRIATAADTDRAI